NPYALYKQLVPLAMLLNHLFVECFPVHLFPMLAIVLSYETCLLILNLFLILFIKKTTFPIKGRGLNRGTTLVDYNVQLTYMIMELIQNTFKCQLQSES